MKLTKTIARKVLTIVDAGLAKGTGSPEPGKLCVEAAVCLALGLPHGDNPPCVGTDVRVFKIGLNDCAWTDDAARAKGMRKLAIGQLGSDTINQEKFKESVCIKGTNRLLPTLFRCLAEDKACPNKEEMLKAVALCEGAKTIEEARSAAKIASAYAYAYASAYASAYAYAYAYASASAYAYASASASASASAFYNERLGKDYILNLIAQIGLEALIECKSPGCKWLDLCD